jgi:hypothetical protein
MSQGPDLSNQKKPENAPETELPASWKQIQTAVWLIGLAILAWRDWWWPGILVLVAISGLVQAGIKMYLSKQRETQLEASQAKDLAKERGEWLPSICPACGAPLSVATVQWTGPATADCPYCKANLKKAV